MLHKHASRACSLRSQQPAAATVLVSNHTQWCSAPTPIALVPRSSKLRASLDDDPNTEEGDDDSVSRPRQPSSSPTRRARRWTRSTGGRKAERTPTADELRAMGYDDVDEFPDDGLPRERMQLHENDPMFVPTLTDEELAEDPEGHRSGYVAVIGKPNAGKSCLINALVGQKLSIVCFKPQTTRHRIMGIASGKEYQMVLFDTPGIIEKKRTKLEERMMSAVVSSIQGSEAIIAVVDAADKPYDALAMFQPGSDWSGPPMAVLLNKADVMEPPDLQEVATWYKENCRAEQVFVGSALNGQGIAELKAWAVSRLPEGPTLYSKDIVSEQPERFFVAELIREKVFFQYAQEIPYSVQVNIVEFNERPKPMKDFIKAVIMVERDSQVPIVVGKGGSALKMLGEAARKDIEAFLDRPVYLELVVECSEQWRENKDALKTFGYFDPMLT